MNFTNIFYVANEKSSKIQNKLNCFSKNLIRFTTPALLQEDKTQQKGKGGKKVDNSPSLFVDFSSDRPADTESYTSL